MREKSGMTLEAAARMLDKTRSSLGRIETGQTKADVHLIRSMMDLYDHYDPDLVDLAREAAKPGWWRKYNIDDRGFLSMETEAATELEFSIMHVPGLLQTEDYMRAIFAAGLAPSRGDEVAARLHRQLRLTDQGFPLELAAIIDEAVLRKEVGGREVMLGQLAHLVESAELPTVTLQVLRNSDGAHVGMDGAFVVLGFPHEDELDMLFVSYIAGSLHLEKPEDVAVARLAFDRLRSEALSPADSIAFIERVRDEW